MNSPPPYAGGELRQELSPTDQSEAESALSVESRDAHFSSSTIYTATSSVFCSKPDKMFSVPQPTDSVF